MITNPARLRVDHSQLVIAQDDDVLLPVEDIAVLVLESPQIALSSAVLSRLAECGVMLLVCGPKHMPVLAGVPYAGHSRLSGVQRMQLATTIPFRKRCWQKIIQRKIHNQAQCLRILNNDKYTGIEAFTVSVASGDPANVESAAAKAYFDALFGSDFVRGESDGTNAAMNYGYAVVRAVVVRALSAHGFLLTQGIHHSSELNPFNLADDFLEPLRPMVDLRVASFTSIPAELDKDKRAQLVGLLAHEVLIDGKRQSLVSAADIMASSFLAAAKKGDTRLLKLPELLPLELHRYE